MTDWQEIALQANERATALYAEVQQLRAQLDGEDGLAMSHLQLKTDRQRKALDRLNRKVLTQRFRLRLLASLGRDVTVEEYIAARDLNSNGARIEDYVAV